MKPFRPGQVKPPLPEKEVPKWYGQPKDAKGRPLDPDTAPEKVELADTHYHVAPGIAMMRPGALPNKRGVGGRPSKAEAPSKAAEVIQATRELTPPLHNIPQRGKSWEAEYDKAERDIERQEATALLGARKERLDAIQEETLIRQSNRRLAMGFGAVGINSVNIMNIAVGEIGKRVKDPEQLKSMSLKELDRIIATAGSVTSKAQQAVESMARAERYILRHPLEDGIAEDDDVADMSPEDAKTVLENLTKSLNASMKVIRGTPEVVAVQTRETDDES
jgi:hypothetical protein